MTSLNKRFQTLDHFQPSRSNYQLLPFRFMRTKDQRYLATNFTGEAIALEPQALIDLIHHRLKPSETFYQDLKSKHFLMDDTSNVAIDLLAAKYRTQKSFLEQGTSLFMLVGTLRCEHSCPYCQVSRRSEDHITYDMPLELIPKLIEFIFSTPSTQIKIEFQGGEPLLNFEFIKQVTWAALEKNRTLNKDLAFVITTNLAMLTDEHLDFCKTYNIDFSTSLDGPDFLHNTNRPRSGQDSHQRTINGIERIRSTIGLDRVSALMTTTEKSLAYPQEIIDAYLALGFQSLFLRPISPYGFAIKTKQSSKYNIAQWLEFYFEALGYILHLNRQGTFFREEYTTLILKKILRPFATSYVDLQSPAGLGISCMLVNYNGDIYASDEARMLAEMGDHTFRLGHLNTHSYLQVMTSEQLWKPLRETIAETTPMCSECPFVNYCGSDPLFHHAMEQDWVGHKSLSPFCHKNMSVIEHLFDLLEKDKAAASILQSWIHT